jgi:hypothetical protein
MATQIPSGARRATQCCERSSIGPSAAGPGACASPSTRSHWDLSVLLVGDERLDASWLAWLLDDLPAGPTDRARQLDERLRRARWPRYRDGWQRYVDDDDPAAVATVIVDNEDLARPSLLRI